MLRTTRLKVNVYELPYDTIPAQMYGGRQPAGCVGLDGAIWFASSRGAVRVLPQPRARVASPRVLLTGINADGRELPFLPQLVFPASLSRLEITFAPLLLRSQENVRFRYQLEGFDQDWIYAGTSRVASYTNLPSRKYRFRVVAFEVNNPSAVSEASFELRKEATLLWYVVVRYSLSVNGRVADFRDLPIAHSFLAAPLQSSSRRAQPPGARDA